MRPELPQFVVDPDEVGSVQIFHTNNWPGTRQTGSHNNGDLPPDVAHDALTLVQERLTQQRWDLTTAKTKILMLTHRVLASEQGYSALPSIFRFNESFTKNNRHAMEDLFPRELKRCASSEHPASLMMIDVDRFKTFNDQFGHVAGDRALSAVAHVLKKQFRTKDLLARYGGDEFAVLLPEVSENEALVIAERVRAAVSGSTSDGSDSLIRVPVEVSIGVAELEAQATYESLLRSADAALYRAKDAGRNTVCN